MFNLPASTVVNRVVPKNAFDEYTNTRQKKMLSDKILRITWANKLSLDTTNLPAGDVEEIQIFKIELKEKSTIKEILDIIQKAIPYHIIFHVWYGEEYYISTAAKHKNPINEDAAVIDYVFETPWLQISSIPFAVGLKKNLDLVFKNFCGQLSSNTKTSDNIQELVSEQKSKDKLNREIARLKSRISREKQFNIKVELNMKLKQLEKTQSKTNGFG